MKHSIVMVALCVLGLAAGCGGDDGASADPSDFQETPWELVSGQDIDLTGGEAPTATFADGTVSGSTGCNRFNGPYTVDGDLLDIGALASTLMACTSPGDAIESAYVAALDLVETWAIDGEELVLSGGEGEELLRYEVASTTGA